jgi:hypothetical protein
MGYLAAADATQMAAETQAQCLLALEQLDAIEAEAILDDHLSTLFG